MKESLTFPLHAQLPKTAGEQPGPRDVLAVRFHLTSATLSLVVLATSIGVLAGWWLRIPWIRSISPSFAAMPPNSALALVLTGVALWLHRGERFTPLRDTTLRVCAGLAATVAFATLIEHFTGWRLGIDDVLFFGGSPAPLETGRIPLAAAACFMLVNTGLLVADTPGRYGIAQVLIAGALMLASINAVGYVFGLEDFTGVASYSAMAMPTSIGVLCLCLGFFFARPDEGLMDSVIDSGAGGLAIRQLLPAVFCLPLMLAWLSWQGVRAGWYEPSFAMAVFVALAINVLSYAVWAGGHVLRTFDEKRRAAEVERLQSEERLRKAVTDAPVPMIIHDSTDRVLHMSEGWARYSGFTQQDSLTLAEWIAHAQPKDAPPITAHFQNASKSSETTHGGEWMIRTKTETERAWEFSTTPLGHLGTDRTVFVTTAVDVTERKRAEADLRRMNEGLEQRIAERTAEITRANEALKRQSDQLKEQATLLDLVRDGILVRDLYGMIVYWSEGASEMYGWRPEHALGAVSHALLKTEYPRPVAEIEAEVVKTGYWEGEVVQTTQSGARVPVESRWTLTRTERGAPQGFLEVNRDIGARKRAQDSLRDSEVRFRAVAETAVEGIVSADGHGAVTYWNPGAERLFGRSAKEMLGQPAALALPERVLAANPEQTVGTTFEADGRRRDGSPVPLELSLTSWTTTQGARFFTVIARDITERKQTEHALEAKADELARSNQELEQFAYVASHDLQEPLRMVSNYTQLLGRRYRDKLDADANEFIDFAVDGAKRMQDLIHDLLEYARVGTRGKEFKPTPLDRVVDDAVANLSGAIEEAHAKINVSTLPTIACDSSQLTQVFQNLMGNAIKFRRPGAEPVITVTASRADKLWTVAIADNGIGIEPKYFDRIFQMFQRLHGRGEYPGTGIGLALCKKIVERHGGRIRVESEPGRGTTFSFTIPETLPVPAQAT